jgi:hypothetical protein
LSQVLDNKPIKPVQGSDGKIVPFTKQKNTMFSKLNKTRDKNERRKREVKTRGENRGERRVSCLNILGYGNMIFEQIRALDFALEYPFELAVHQISVELTLSMFLFPFICSLIFK